MYTGSRVGGPNPPDQIMVHGFYPHLCVVVEGGLCSCIVYCRIVQYGRVSHRPPVVVEGESRSRPEQELWWPPEKPKLSTEAAKLATLAPKPAPKAPEPKAEHSVVK